MTDLYEFLAEIHVQQYYQKFVNNLKVTSISQLRDVEDGDLVDIGMSRSEVERMKLHLRKKFQSGTFGQLKKFFGKSRDNKCARSPSLNEKDRLIAGPSEKHVIPQNSVTMLHQLGTGRFGSTVRLGVWTKEDGMQIQVAVKCLPKAKLRKPVSDFLQDISILFGASCPHLVPIFGVILDVDNILLVMEHAPLQSLTKCLKDTSLRSSLSVRLLCDLAKQIADGMAYLEHRQLVHGNLCARNILVISVYQVKITDFGLSGAVGFGRSETEIENSDDLQQILPWCAPECASSFSYTSASDVWSFGVTLWEIFSYGDQPWEDLPVMEIAEAVSAPSNRRLQKPKFCPDEWYTEMLKCWELRASNRPKFSEISSSLAQLKLSRVVVQKDDWQPYSGCIQCKKNDIITVLSKNPESSPCPGFWLGVFEASNEVGIFNPNNTAPHLEIIISDVNLQRNTKINRSWSLRASLRPSSRKLTPSMISMPQNDMRHLGHVGFDGVVIGEVPFLSSSSRASSVSMSMLDRDSHASTNSLSVNGGDLLKPRPMGSSVSTSSIFTSSASRDYSEKETENCDFSDLKLPDLGDDLNFGGSLYDEVMAALNQALTSRGVPSGGTTGDDGRRTDVTTSSSNSTIVAESHTESDSEDGSQSSKEVTSFPSSRSFDGQDQLASGPLRLTSRDYASNRLHISNC